MLSKPSSGLEKNTLVGTTGRSCFQASKPQEVMRSPRRERIILGVLERLVSLSRDGEPPCGSPRTIRSGADLSLSASPAASALAGLGKVIYDRGNRAIGVQRDVDSDFHGEVWRRSLADFLYVHEVGCLLLLNNLPIRIDPTVDDQLIRFVSDVCGALVVRAGEVSVLVDVGVYAHASGAVVTGHLRLDVIVAAERDVRSGTGMGNEPADENLLYWLQGLPMLASARRPEQLFSASNVVSRPFHGF